MQYNTMKKPSPLQFELAGQIAAWIRDEKLAAGTPLREEGLAARLGVSRTPVRAALKLLGRSGHVRHKENTGVFVAPGGARRAAFRIPAATTTHDELYRRLLADRASATLADTVSEAELLARYGVPRSLLAKVLLRVHREGLVERRKGHGWQFQPTLATADSITESFRFRAMVEPAGLLEPGFHADAAELAGSREAHRRFLALEPRVRTASAFFEMNLRFHEMLARSSGNRFLLQTIQQMNRLRKFQEFASFSVDSRLLAQSCEEHLAILEAVGDGDREWAAALMRKHLAAGLSRVVTAGQAAGSVFDNDKKQS